MSTVVVVHRGWAPCHDFSALPPKNCAPTMSAGASGSTYSSSSTTFLLRIELLLCFCFCFLAAYNAGVVLVLVLGVEPVVLLVVRNDSRREVEEEEEESNDGGLTLQASDASNISRLSASTRMALILWVMIMID